MSVSLTMIPVALALRVVMGKEGFNNWIQSNEVLKKTTFKSERDLIVTVKKCGYDAEKWGGSIKTHFQGGKDFFFWELRDGVWYAIFSKYDSVERINQLMVQLEKLSGKGIFNENEEELVIKRPQRAIFPTNFRDRNLLIKVLVDNGMEPQELEDGKIICDLGSAKIQFFQENNDSIVTVEIIQGADMQSIFKHLWVLDDEYKSNVQNLVYENLLEKVEEKGLKIEEEQVLEDNSIVITLNIQR